MVLVVAVVVVVVVAVLEFSGAVEVGAVAVFVEPAAIESVLPEVPEDATVAGWTVFGVEVEAVVVEGTEVEDWTLAVMENGTVIGWTEVGCAFIVVLMVLEVAAG